MNTNFHQELSKDHERELLREAQLARRAHEAGQSRRRSSRPGRARSWLIALGAAAAAATTGAAFASASALSPGRPMTPNDCIRINGGDYNACNVGNSGRGDLPYRPVFAGRALAHDLRQCHLAGVGHYC